MAGVVLRVKNEKNNHKTQSLLLRSSELNCGKHLMECIQYAKSVSHSMSE